MVCLEGRYREWVFSESEADGGRLGAVMTGGVGDRKDKYKTIYVLLLLR